MKVAYLESTYYGVLNVIGNECTAFKNKKATLVNVAKYVATIVMQPFVTVALLTLFFDLRFFLLFLNHKCFANSSKIAR